MQYVFKAYLAINKRRNQFKVYKIEQNKSQAKSIESYEGIVAFMTKMMRKNSKSPPTKQQAFYNRSSS